MVGQADGALFSAVSPSATQLAYLLRCMSFASKAQVKITADGLRFSAEQTSVMEAFVFLSKSLFSSYSYQDGMTDDELPEDRPPPPSFAVSLPALIETLQIFSLGDSTGRDKGSNTDSFAAHRLQRYAGGQGAFGTAALGTSGLCRLSYDAHGSPLSIHLNDAGVRTTCDLTTYETDGEEHSHADIPFDRENLFLKTITRASVLADCIAELSSMQPQTLELIASPEAPYLSLSGHGGPLSSATVEFSRDPQLLETFQCVRLVEASYSFALVKAAYRAMCSASKVSIRVDGQGVLSLQFLIDVDNAPGGLGRGSTAANTPGGGGGGGSGRESVAFVDFRIVPLVDEKEQRRDEQSSTTEDDEDQ